MAQSRDIVDAAKSVSDQQALVNIALARKEAKTYYHVIPGGKSLFTDKNPVDPDRLRTLLYTWLRKVRAFDECTLCFAKQGLEITTSTTQTQSFPSGTQVPIWDIPAKGKSYLARVMAEEIMKGRLVSITAKKEGLFVARETTKEATVKPGLETWEPYMKFSRTRPPSYTV